MKPDAKDVSACFNYIPETGQIVWAVSRRGVQTGKVAGSKKPDGYIQLICLGAHLYAHHIVWAMHKGAWPDIEIDHINGNPSDNRIENLREATRTQNSENIRRPRMDCKAGIIGVQRKRMRWSARITVNGVVHRLGVFDTAEEAGTAYLSAKRSLHAFCTI